MIYVSFGWLCFIISLFGSHFKDDAPRPGQPGQAPRPAGVAAPVRA